MTQPPAKAAATLIAGLGYVGCRLAARLTDSGQEVVALVRTPERLREAAALNAAAIVCDLDQPITSSQLPPQIDLLYYLVPPVDATDSRLAVLLDRLQSNPPRRLIYISTTGVYGDQQGAWVNEQTPVAPQTKRAQRRLVAESLVTDFSAQTGCQVVILRVAGIYGPGRLPIARIRAQRPVLTDENAAWSNRIHVDDLVAALLNAGSDPDARGIYNISDGEPSSMSSYFNLVADTFGLPHPPVISRTEMDGQLSQEMQSYLSESRRIDNQRMREELGIEPRYPELRVGLAAIWDRGESGAD